MAKVELPKRIGVDIDDVVGGQHAADECAGQDAHSENGALRSPFKSWLTSCACPGLPHSLVTYHISSKQ